MSLKLGIHVLARVEFNDFLELNLDLLPHIVVTSPISQVFALHVTVLIYDLEQEVGGLGCHLCGLELHDQSADQLLNHNINRTWVII
jgi:hypothetical protein